MDKQAEKKMEEKLERRMEKKLAKKRINIKEFFDPVSEAREAATTTLKLMTTALTLVAGLAWNEVIKKVSEIYIAKWFAGAGEVVGLLIYAVVLTVIVVLVVNRLKKISGRIKSKVVVKK